MQKLKLSPKLKKWLVSAHIIFIATWLGATLAMFTLNIYATQAADIHTLKVTTQNLQILDDIFIKYPALGALISGLILSIFSNWGLTNYYWIMVKAVLTVLIIIYGIVGLNPWLSQANHLIAALGWDVKQNPAYIYVNQMGLGGALLNSALMAFMIVISSLKPWGKRKPFTWNSAK